MYQNVLIIMHDIVCVNNNYSYQYYLIFVVNSVIELFFLCVTSSFEVWSQSLYCYVCPI